MKVCMCEAHRALRVLLDQLEGFAGETSQQLMGWLSGRVQKSLVGSSSLDMLHSDPWPLFSQAFTAL